MYIVKSKLGFTLLEVVVAISVIVTGVIAGLTLTTHNLNVSYFSEKNLIAANLAREGLEAVRQIRDSNWLANAPFESGLTDNGYKITVGLDEEDGRFIVAWQNTDIGNCDDCSLYINADSGVYSHDGSGLRTPFRQMIYFKEICWQDELQEETVLDYADSCQDHLLELVGLEAKNVLEWTESGALKQINAIDRFYDWR